MVITRLLGRRYKLTNFWISKTGTSSWLLLRLRLARMLPRRSFVCFSLSPNVSIFISQTWCCVVICHPLCWECTESCEHVTFLQHHKLLKVTFNAGMATLGTSFTASLFSLSYSARIASTPDWRFSSTENIWFHLHWTGFHIFFFFFLPLLPSSSAYIDVKINKFIF